MPISNGIPYESWKNRTKCQSLVKCEAIITYNLKHKNKKEYEACIQIKILDKIEVIITQRTGTDNNSKKPPHNAQNSVECPELQKGSVSGLTATPMPGVLTNQI